MLERIDLQKASIKDENKLEIKKLKEEKDNLDKVFFKKIKT